MLRDELTEISKIAEEKECSDMLDALKIRCEHAVSVIPSKIPLREFNCFEYALGLWDMAIYQEMKKKLAYAGFSSVFCNPSFMQWLKDNKLLSGRGDLILYESIHGDIYHAGIITGSAIVTSKWGTGCIYIHEQLEVPNQYGTMPRTYNKPDAGDVLQWFKNYLNELASIINSFDLTPKE